MQREKLLYSGKYLVTYLYLRRFYTDATEVFKNYKDYSTMLEEEAKNDTLEKIDESAAENSEVHA